MAKRNNGVHFAEQQLLPLIVPTIIGVAGLLLYSFSAGSPHSSSSWGIIMGMAAEIVFLDVMYQPLTLLRVDSVSVLLYCNNYHHHLLCLGSNAIKSRFVYLLKGR